MNEKPPIPSAVVVSGPDCNLLLLLLLCSDVGKRVVVPTSPSRSMLKHECYPTALHQSPKSRFDFNGSIGSSSSCKTNTAQEANVPWLMTSPMMEPWSLPRPPPPVLDWTERQRQGQTQRQGRGHRQRHRPRQGQRQSHVRTFTIMCWEIHWTKNQTTFRSANGKAELVHTAIEWSAKVVLRAPAAAPHHQGNPQQQPGSWTRLIHDRAWERALGLLELCDWAAKVLLDLPRPSVVPDRCHAIRAPAMARGATSKDTPVPMAVTPARLVR